MAAVSVDLGIDFDGGEKFEPWSLAGLGGGEPNREPLAGVKALMLAVLEDAIRCYLEGGGASAAEAEAWVQSRRRTSPFGFEVVCEALGLEADAVRAALRRLKDATESRPTFTRRVRDNARAAGHVCLRERRTRSREGRGQLAAAPPAEPAIA